MLMQLKDKCWHNTATHQEGTETVEAEEVEDSEVGPAGVLLSWQEVRFGVAFLPIHRSHHDLLPSLSSSTSGYVNNESEILAQFLNLKQKTFYLRGLGLETHRNNIRTAWGNVWKLLLRLIWVPSTKAIFPKIWIPVNMGAPMTNTETDNIGNSIRNILTS